MKTRLAIHVHSDWSYDGSWSLERISHEFNRRGYNAVLMCEHCRTFDSDRWRRYRDRCESSSTGALLIPGIEYSDPENVVHIPTWGLDEFLAPEPVSTCLEDWLREHPESFSVLAHPTRRGAWRVVDDELVSTLHAVEIWNRKADGFAPSKDARRFIEAGLRPILGLDFHRDKQRFPMAVRVSGATEDEILRDLREGRFVNEVFGCGERLWSCRLGAGVLRVAEWARRYASSSLRFGS